jgi:hypothetical protein
MVISAWERPWLLLIEGNEDVIAADTGKEVNMEK